jgi:hypothetical protein
MIWRYRINAPGTAAIPGERQAHRELGDPYHRFVDMARKRRLIFPIMLAELAIASAETIAHRSWMIATGRCTPREYRRMLAEKMKAAGQSGRAALAPRAKATALIAPWHRAARANAARLRRR